MSKLALICVLLVCLLVCLLLGIVSAKSTGKHLVLSEMVLFLISQTSSECASKVQAAADDPKGKAMAIVTGDLFG